MFEFIQDPELSGLQMRPFDKLIKRDNRLIKRGSTDPGRGKAQFGLGYYRN